jgi:hypothetical protein
MAITAYFQATGFTAPQYDKLMQILDQKGLTHPEGRLSHLAYDTPEGWRVVDVWESPDKLQAFARELMPAIASVGFTPPVPQVYPTHNFINDQVIERVGL